MTPAKLYSFIWLSILVLCYMNLGQYNQITTLAWVYILGSVLAFLLGTVLMLWLYESTDKPIVRENKIITAAAIDVDRLKRMILFAVFISLGVIIINFVLSMGSRANLIQMFFTPNIMYSKRVNGELSSAIPYLDGLAIYACAFSGIRWSILKKFDFLTISPLIVVVLSSVVSLGRAKIIIGFMLFLFGASALWAEKARYKKYGTVLITGVMIYLSGYIRIYRGGFIDKTLSNYPDSIVSGLGYTNSALLLSIYDNITSPIFVFSQSFGRFANYDHNYFGRETFAPVHRLLYRFGVGEGANYYESFVDIGGIYTNVGSYLKDIFVDFSVPGIIVFPMLFGLISEYVHLKYKATKDIKYSFLQSMIYTYIIFSPIVNLLRLGYFMFPLAIGYYLIQRRGIVTRVSSDG